MSPATALLSAALVICDSGVGFSDFSGQSTVRLYGELFRFMPCMWSLRKSKLFSHSSLHTGEDMSLRLLHIYRCKALCLRIQQWESGFQAALAHEPGVDCNSCKGTAEIDVNVDVGVCWFSADSLRLESPDTSEVRGELAHDFWLECTRKKGHSGACKAEL